MTYDFMKSSVEAIGFKVRLPYRELLGSYMHLKVNHIMLCCNENAWYVSWYIVMCRIQQVAHICSGDLASTWFCVEPGIVDFLSQVVAVVVTTFVSNTYHAMVHYEGGDGGCISAQVDSRPSDAINLALRTGTPVYVSNEVCLSVNAEAVNTLYT